MTYRFGLAVLVLAALPLNAPLRAASEAPSLRVCSDPNNLPFSNRAGEGFEDQLARIVAADLGMRVEHFFWAQRRGFFRNTLKAGKCDLVMGVPRDFDMLDTTEPYYRSGYVFVSRESLRPAIRSLDDRRLATLRVGVPVVGDDYANPPPAHALARRGIVSNVIGFSVFGDYGEDSPPLELIRAVAQGKIDVAVAWGPQAGYVAKHSSEALRLVPVTPRRDGPYPFVFEISMAVAHGNTQLKTQLNRFLIKNRLHIEKLLHDYGVPLL
jgi:quinoprotein dehydrogenase-associated probable ABC transporter substrate-binding protein